MRKAIDLQLHSHYSDGSKSPTELISHLVSKKIVVASLTDHNTIHGQYEFQAAAKKYKIKVIPGVELYMQYKKRVLHILAYNFDTNNAQLHDRLRETQIKRKKLIEGIVPALKRRGLILNISQLFSQPSTYIGVANVVRALETNQHNHRVFQRALKKKHYDFYEVYNKFFAPGTSCYLPEVALSTYVAFKTIKQAGGVPILAHPGWQLSFHDDHVILELKHQGLKGIECFNSHHNWNQTAHYMNLAKENNLIVTAGSDYHGDLPGDNIIESYHEYTSLPYEIYEQIKLF